MFCYLLNIAIIIIAGKVVLPSDNEFRRVEQAKKRVCIVGATNWILLSGLRHVTVGADTKAYQYMFGNVDNISWNSALDQIVKRITLSNTEKDPAFFLIEKSFRLVSDNYHIFLIFIACSFFIPLAIWIYRNSSDAVLSFVVFSTLFYSFFAITGQRQMIATAIAFFGGLEFIEKRKPIAFVLTVLIASFIHASAIALLPMYFFQKIKITGRKLVFYWIAIIMSFILRSSLMEILKLISGYERYSQSESAQAGAFLFLLLAMTVVYSLFYRQIQSGNNRQINIASNSLFAACFLSPLLLINESCMRVVQYYSIFIIILLPEYKNIFTKFSRRIFTVIVCAVMIVLFARNNPVYHFFWETV